MELRGPIAARCPLPSASSGPLLHLLSSSKPSYLWSFTGSTWPFVPSRCQPSAPSADRHHLLSSLEAISAPHPLPRQSLPPASAVCVSPASLATHMCLCQLQLCRLSTVAHACNPNTLGGQGRQITRLGDGDHPGQHGETPSLLKYKNQLGVVVRTCNPSYSGG